MIRRVVHWQNPTIRSRSASAISPRNRRRKRSARRSLNRASRQPPSQRPTFRRPTRKKRRPDRIRLDVAQRGFGAHRPRWSRCITATAPRSRRRRIHRVRIGAVRPRRGSPPWLTRSIRRSWISSSRWARYAAVRGRDRGLASVVPAFPRMGGSERTRIARPAPRIRTGCAGGVVREGPRASRRIPRVATREALTALHARCRVRGCAIAGPRLHAACAGSDRVRGPCGNMHP